MRYWVILIVLLLAGCKTGPEVPVITDPPDVAQLPKVVGAPLRKRHGTAQVAGKLVLSTHDFGHQPIIGQEVSLVPQSPETDALMKSHFGNGGVNITAFPWEKLTAKVSSTRLKTRSDKNGKFVFRSVPAGSWIATGCMRWQTPGKYVPEGGCMVKRFALSKGQRFKLRFTQ